MPVVAADVRFHCPSCGAGLRARPRDGGSVISCHQCGESVHAPRLIPPAETAPNVSVLTPGQSRDAAAGCRLLQFALMAFVLQVLAVAAGYAAWVAWLGPAKLLERDPGLIYTHFVPFWLADLALLLTQTLLKLWGYGKLEPAGRALGVSPWLRAANAAVLLRLVGYSLACLPWFTGRPLELVPMVWKAIAQIGHLAWMLGIVVEFAILVVWHRLLSEFGGATLSRPVFRYLTATLGAFLTLSAGATLTLIATVAAVRKASPEAGVPIARGARLNFDALPASDYWPLLALAGAALAAVAMLAYLYTRLLRGLRRGLLASVT